MYKLILVEDEPIIRRGLKQLIEHVIGGFEVAGEADNGREALELLKRVTPDLLITDIRMAEMNGIEMIKKRKSQDAHAQLDEEDEADQGRQLIRKVKELVMERLDQEISLQVIADQVHLNHQYLSALFKSETGQNFSDYVTHCRMNKAKQILKETNLKIYEVAALSGYISSKHFMAVFKEVVGKTPSQYRERPD